MNLGELNEIQDTVVSEQRAAASAIRTRDMLARARQAVVSGMNFVEFTNTYFYHTHSTENALLTAGIIKYLPDILREAELRLEAEAREHKNKAKVLTEQVNAFFAPAQEAK